MEAASLARETLAAASWALATAIKSSLLLASGDIDPIDEVNLALRSIDFRYPLEPIG